MNGDQIHTNQKYDAKPHCRYFHLSFTLSQKLPQGRVVLFNGNLYITTIRRFQRSYHISWFITSIDDLLPQTVRVRIKILSIKAKA